MDLTQVLNLNYRFMEVEVLIFSMTILNGIYLFLNLKMKNLLQRIILVCVKVVMINNSMSLNDQSRIWQIVKSE